MASCSNKTLFGGARGWLASDWTSSDDRVRGGNSQSYLKIRGRDAVFCGHLDIDTLGGAGFASQRTVGDDAHWDLGGSDAIELLINTAESDLKRYTFILKDEILPRNPENGREQSTTSWEYDFTSQQGVEHPLDPRLRIITIPYGKLRPTYRGREKDPGRALKLIDIRRISIMMRSYFGEQKGDFSLSISSIAAINTENRSHESMSRRESRSSASCSLPSIKAPEPSPQAEKTLKSVWTIFRSLCDKM